VSKAVSLEGQTAIRCQNRLFFDGPYKNSLLKREKETLEDKRRLLKRLKETKIQVEVEEVSPARHLALTLLMQARGHQAAGGILQGGRCPCR
jgi:hypothetical protein